MRRIAIWRVIALCEPRVDRVKINELCRGRPRGARTGTAVNRQAGLTFRGYRCSFMRRAGPIPAQKQGQLCSRFITTTARCAWTLRATI